MQAQKVPHPEQVDFSGGLHSHLPNRLGPKQVIGQLNQNRASKI